MSSSVEKTDACLSCEFQDNLDILRETYFFSALSLEILKVFAYLCTREKFKEGDYLISEGDDDGQAFFIISGKARLSYAGEEGERIVRDYGPEMFLGGLSLVGKMRRLFSLQAITETVCLVLTKEKFTKAMAQFPDQMPKIFNILVDRICTWEERTMKELDSTCDACQNRVGVSLI
jgi:CRP/FNR family transcriptional regulator, cyclic AMP receptor protein